MGDSSDNIPGVPGIGAKTAEKIITAYGSIENAHAHADEIKPARASNNLKEHYDMARMSKVLAAIDTKVPLEGVSVEAATLENMYSEAAYQMMKTLEFKNILNRFGRDAVAVPVLSAAEEISSEDLRRQKIFEAMRKKRIGVFPICEADIFGLILAYDEESFWMPVDSAEALAAMARMVRRSSGAGDHGSEKRPSRLSSDPVGKYSGYQFDGLSAESTERFL